VADWVDKYYDILMYEEVGRLMGDGVYAGMKRPGIFGLDRPSVPLLSAKSGKVSVQSVKVNWRVLFDCLSGKGDRG
jgi:hypothetical protein